MNPPKHIDWFIAEFDVILEDGFPITSFRLDYAKDEDVLCEWALHLRKHYESDIELIESVRSTGMSVEEYLRTYIIPQSNDPFGPPSRSSDFTEIIVSDLLEFVDGYSVPRCKQRNRSGKTQSEHGTDIIGYKFIDSFMSPNIEDEMIAVEVKAGLSSDKYDPLTLAVNDSHKFDEVRHAHTLNFYRKKLRDLRNDKQADEIIRFQQKSETDYRITYIAAAVISRAQVQNNVVLGIKGSELFLKKNNKLFLVHGDKLMQLANSIYDRCIV